MADIELVIKIPEEIQLALINNIQLSPDQQSICDSYIKHAVTNGTPLPKEHGDLKDIDEIIEKIRRLPNGGRQWFVNAEAVFNIILDAPTIIEADKENEQ